MIEILYIDRISLKFVRKGPIGSDWVLVQVMAWRRIGNKPLPEPMLSQFTDAYMRGWGDELKFRPNITVNLTIWMYKLTPHIYLYKVI